MADNDSLPVPNFKEPTGLGWDKTMHFGAGALSNELGSAIYRAVSRETGMKPDKKMEIATGLLFAILAGSGKEMLDAQEKGNKWDWEDLGATVAGALPGAGIRFTHKF